MRDGHVKKRFSGEQIIGFLKQAEARVPVRELCRQHGFSDASFCNWRAKYGRMTSSCCHLSLDVRLNERQLGGRSRRSRTFRVVCAARFTHYAQTRLPIPILPKCEELSGVRKRNVWVTVVAHVG